MSSIVKTWTSAVYNCVEENYGNVLNQWVESGSLEPDSWEETLCWAGILRWNSMVSGLPATLSTSFPNTPHYADIIQRLRSENMYTLANSLDEILKTLSRYPDVVSDIQQAELERLHFPMREGWQQGFVLNSIIVSDIAPEQMPLYHYYRGLGGTGAIFEIYRFLDDLQSVDPALDINTDLSSFRGSVLE